MSTKIPYSYFLYHIPTGLKYYGIKHAKNCHPDQLWKTYFSSSSIVKQLIKDHGADSFLYTVRKTFTDSKSALLWEHKVLRRLNAAQRSDWINRHNGGSKFRSPGAHSDRTKQSISKKLKGRKFTDSHKDKISKGSLYDRQKRRDQGWKMPTDFVPKMLKTRQENIEQGLINPYSKERNAKMSASKTGTKRKYLPDGSFVMIRPDQADQ